jgi:SPP1 family predicted phage head-tail adaptor
MIVNLDRRITIQRKAETKDAHGAPQASWTALATNGTVWAEVRDTPPSRAEQQQREGLEQLRNTVRVRMRYRTDVDATMRIVHGSRVLQIVGGPAELGRGEFLEVTCEAIEP